MNFNAPGQTFRIATLLVIGLIASFDASAIDGVAGDSLWSIRPLVRPDVPRSTSGSGASPHPIDRFIEATLAENGLSRSATADRRTLIRRLYFDLIGLPPTPGEIEEFLADHSNDAYERLVDRLLASPQHGERWARHWLDVVHFGETHGYDKDKPRPNAWPYRDYVIRAFNEDKPWSQFIEEQIAGDVLYPFTRDGIEALGFISAGPWDFIGHAEVPETKIDGKVARHLDRDDMVANTMQSFNSLTVQCAQCHDHKFDPILQEDYYALQAVFAALDRADREYDYDPAIAKERESLRNETTALTREKEQIDTVVQERAGTALQKIDESIQAASEAMKNNEAFGYHSQIATEQDAEKRVQVDLGQLTALSRISLHPAKDDFNNIGEGFGFPVRFKVEIADNSVFTANVRMIADQRADDFPNPKITALSYDVNGEVARFIRVTATKLAPRQNDYIFALAELRVFDADEKNVAVGAGVTALDSIEAPRRWSKGNLTDGWFPGLKDTESEEIERLRDERTSLIAASTEEQERIRLGEIDESLNRLKPQLEKLPEPRKAYVGTVHTGSGSFTGTGADGGRPRPIFLLARGNVQKPGELVRPGTLSALSGDAARFDLAEDHAEGDRRIALARWLSSRDNPLTWRSIVNRVWQQHFGQGLVDTPNDFGNVGGKPSHPELLDWLACEFRDGGQSLKSLHRLIVTGATYRQRSTTVNARASRVDSNNRLLWRMNRRKLEAEAVRDSMLFVSGKLDTSMGGPSFKDFVVEKPEHSPHYQYHLYDPNDPTTHRRTIYRFLVRSQPQPFMAALDCADPSMQVAKRNESVTPLQSLAMLNNALVVALSKHFADSWDEFDMTVDEKVNDAFYSAIGRPPTETEANRLISFAEGHGMENLCRAIFNLNEFTFVD